MKLVSTEITDLKSEFEGGNALSVDWYSVLRRAGNKLLNNVNPETLKRRVPIYGGIGRNLYVYYVPDDVQVPSAIYTQPDSRKPEYIYQPPAAFYQNNKQDTFTIEYINGVRFAVFRHSVAPDFYTLHECDDTSGVTSDQTLTLNTHDYISGTAALQRTFTERSGTEATADFTSNTFTSNAHGLSDGARIVLYSTDELPGGVSEYRVYFVRDSLTNTFAIAEEDGGTAVDLTSNGTGTLYWYTADTNEISYQYTSGIDISAFKEGIVVMPIILEDARNTTRIEFVLETDTDNYYVMNSDTGAVGATLIDGINIVRFRVAEATTVGAPDDASINRFRLRIISSADQDVVVDRITLQKTLHHYLEYYSNRLFKTSGGAWISEPKTTSDYININRDLEEAFHYEAALLVAKSQTYTRTSREKITDFKEELMLAYNAYWSRHPSSEMPLSYNHLDGPLGTEAYISENLHVETDIDLSELDFGLGTLFADNETPTGTIDGANATFTLDFEPNPTSSLLLWLNGVYQNQGSDYTLSGNVITYTTPPDAGLAGAPHVAFYRHN